MAAPQKVDYARIEPAWRAGLKSIAQMAEDYTKETGISVSTVSLLKHFKAKGIPRNLNAKIQAAAEAKVNEALAIKVNGKASEPKIVEANAVAVAAVKVEHRGMAKRLRDVLAGQLTELEAGDGGELKARIMCAKQASETLKTLIGIEAEAWGFASVPEIPDEKEDFDPVDSARRLAYILAKGDHAMREQETLQ